MPQEETDLINLAYARLGICAHVNHRDYGVFCTCTCLATRHLETPTLNQSFTELSIYTQSEACKPNNQAVKWHVGGLHLIRRLISEVLQAKFVVLARNYFVHTFWLVIGSNGYEQT